MEFIKKNLLLLPCNTVAGKTRALARRRVVKLHSKILKLLYPIISSAGRSRDCLIKSKQAAEFA